MPSIYRTPFGEIPEEEVWLYEVDFPEGIRAFFTNYGATIVGLEVPDKNHLREDVVLGFDTLEGYLGNHPFFGCVCGRYANRIANGTFTLEGQEYKLAQNIPPHHLHGGEQGFNRKAWHEKDIQVDADKASIAFEYMSQDGEEGYPGAMNVVVTYHVFSDRVEIEYHATTTKTTVINLTNHVYFNLSGDLSTSVLDHTLWLQSKELVEVDNHLIPNGNKKSVDGTRFDFQEERAIREEYDHCWVVGSESEMKLIANLKHRASGRTMEVLTTEPGVQVYTGNSLNGEDKGKDVTYQKNSGICLETQHFPDSPNHQTFPTTILKPEQEFTSKTVYKFSVKG